MGLSTYFAKMFFAIYNACLYLILKDFEFADQKDFTKSIAKPPKVP